MCVVRFPFAHTPARAFRLSCANNRAQILARAASQQSNTISACAACLEHKYRMQTVRKGIAPKLKKYNLPRHLWHLLLLLYTRVARSALFLYPNVGQTLAQPSDCPAPIRINCMRFTHVYVCSVRRQAGGLHTHTHTHGGRGWGKRLRFSVVLSERSRRHYVSVCVRP